MVAVTGPASVVPRGAQLLAPPTGLVTERHRAGPTLSVPWNCLRDSCEPQVAERRRSPRSQATGGDGCQVVIGPDYVTMSDSALVTLPVFVVT